MTGDFDFRGFSCPQIGLDPELLELIVVDHASTVVDEFLVRHAASLDKGTPGIAQLASGWLESSARTFDLAWSPEFGDIHALLLSGDDGNQTECAAALALRLNEMGVDGEWTVALPRRTRLRFSNWVLEPADALAVSCDDGRMLIRAADDGHWNAAQFTRQAGAWALDDGFELTALPPMVEGAFRFSLASVGALSATSTARLLDADAYHFTSDDVRFTPEWMSTCREALDLIRSSDERYEEWVGKVLRHLVPLKARKDTFNSGGEKFSPGVICVSDQCLRWPLAEMLVHEATHQYLHILNRLGPLDDGTDENLYFSPFRNKGRPIAYIAIAYHAFANVLLFYRAARERGNRPDSIGSTGPFAQRESTLERQLAQIEEPLRQSRSLTALGRALWEPLHEALHA